MTSIKHTLIAAATLGLCAAAQAAPVEKYSDNFSSLSAWTLLGDVSTFSGYGVATSAHSSFDDDYPLPVGAANLSGHDPVEANLGSGGLESFVGVAEGALNLSAVNQATEGSAFKRSFNVNAGDKLSIDWLLATNDTTIGLDYGFAVIDGQLISLANANDATTPFAQPYPWSTTPGHFEYTFQRSGSITVAFGVVDVKDYSGSTAFGVDQLTITAAVPEPTTYALLLAGLGLVGAVARRHRV